MSQKPNLASMTPEQLRSYKTKWYQDNKKEVNLSRIVKGIQSGSRTINEKTLAKYDLKKNKDGKILIPVKTKIVYTKSDIVNTDPHVINIIFKNDSTSPTPQTEYKGKPLNGYQMQQWFNNVLRGLPSSHKTNEPLSEGVFNEYKRIPTLLFDAFGTTPYDEMRDLSPWLGDAGALITAIDAKKWANSTKSKFIGKVLRLCDEFSPLSDIVNDDYKLALNAQDQEWSSSASASQRIATETKELYGFDVIKKEVELKYSTVSYQYLFLSLYDNVIPRDNLGNVVMIYDQANTPPGKTNYIVLDVNNGSGTLYLRDYKTSGIYKTKMLPLSAKNVSLINTLHGREPSKPVRLFPNQKDKLSSWIPSKSFMGAIDKFNGEHRMGTKYLRKSKISTELLKNTNTANSEAKIKRIVELAFQAGHQVSTQKAAYISPLINLRGNLLYSKDFIEQANDKINEVVHNYGTRSKAKAVPVPVPPTKKVVATKKKK